MNEIGNQIYLTFNENLDFSSGAAPPASAFSVSVDGVAIAVGGATRGLNAKELWLLQFDSTMYQGQNVTVTYTDPTTGDDAAAIQDGDGDDTPSFTTGVDGVPAVVNNSNVMAPLLAPTGFSAEAGDGEVTLSWDPPGSGVTHHDYRFRTGGDYGDWIEIDDSAPGETNASGFTVTEDIVNGTTYTFQLRAGGADDDSPAAVSEEVTPMEVALDPPTNLSATPGDRQAVLTWTPPAADSGYTQHQYRYRAGDGNWERWTTIRDSGPGEANGRRFTVTGLRNATEHRFELRASDAGTGRSEAAATEVTPQGPPRIEGVEVVSSPGLDGDTYGAREEIRIEVTFDQPVEVAGDPRFRFDVGGSDRLAAYDSGGGTEAVLFVYRVEAGDRDGDGIEVGGDALVLDGNDRIRNPAGHDAERTHDGPGRLAGHKVNGARRVGTHTHEAFTHGHSHFNNGKRYYTEEYPSHEHEGHEHPNKANGHRSLKGPLKVHTHHVPEDPDASVSGGPDERGHDRVAHIHRCYDVRPRCNKDDRSGTPGLPIEITHSHAADSEPGHGFDWRGEYFEKMPPMPTQVTATPGAGRVRLAWAAPELVWDPKRLKWVVPAPGLPAHVTHHEYRWTTDGDDLGWTVIPDSDVFGDNRAGFTVTGLDDGTAYTFELRAANDGGGGPAARAETATTATVPEIEGRVAVTSTPDGRYRAGDGIRIAVTFDQPVEVEGDPEFGLSVGGERVAMYRWGGGTHVLVFVYTVRPEDDDGDGIWIGPHDHDTNPTFRLDGDDRIRNAAGQDADLSHSGLGTLSGHRVDGGGQAPDRNHHSHQQFSHSHGHSRGGPPFVQVYGEHTHPYHVHHDTNDGHLSAMRPGLHVHHEQENLRGDFGPDLRGHGGMEHTHLCGDIEPDCNPDKETVQVGDELGLPIRVTHAHGDSEPGHRFDWRGYFREAASGPLLSVTDAEATEGDDGALGFTVRLDREARSEVTADYATADGTATAGTDYTATSGTLTFTPGETAKTVQVPVADDGDEDDGETLTLRLSNASGAGVWSEGGEATGTIHNREAEETAGPPLTASFEDLPGEHDGESAFTFRIAFSERIGWMNGRRLREDVVAVAGGRATAAGRVDRRRDLWQVTVEPDSGADVTVTLEAGAACRTPAAVCTSDGRALSETISATVAGPAQETAVAPLTASFEAVPGEHDGESAFRFRLAFSEPIAISYRSLREDAFAVTGGRVTRGKRVDGRKDLFEITVEPDGGGDVAISLPAGRDCEVSGAICTWGPPRKPLTNTPSATVAGPAQESAPAPLTASFEGMPETHGGGSAFGFRIAFSEAVAIAPGALRADGLRVSGGAVADIDRVDGRADLFEVSVRPDAGGDVTIVLPGGRECGAAGAVCTQGEPARRLANTARATVRGLASLSVADARAREGEDPTLDFAVTLDRASSGTVTVDYATLDGSAKAGEDYTRTSGTLSFAPGETAKTVSVPVLDDAHDEGTEILVLRLENARGAVLADRLAVGRIENTDHMPAAWLARFGRTVTDQVLEAVEERLKAPRAAGMKATLAGKALPSWDGGGKAAANGNDDAAASARALRAQDREATASLRDWLARAGTDGGRGAPGEGRESAGRAQWRPLTGREFVTGTSFALTGAAEGADGFVSLWGRGALSRFDGREGDLSLDGEVTTGLMGADWATERWTAGLAVGHARGEGGYREGGSCAGNDLGAGGCSGEVEARLTGVWPYGALKLTDRLSAWAAAGYGAGELRLMPGDGTEGPFTADLTMAMGAAGMRSEVLRPGAEGGLALALKGDTRFTRTASRATKDARGGKLEAAEADVWLVRAGMESSRRFALGGGASLTPSLEVGLRLDGGDAETGFGTDLGGGLALGAPERGLTLDLKARGLVAHEASGFREWGASASLTWDPRPETDRGFALTLRQSWGGMDALLGRDTLEGLADDNGNDASAGRLEAELGYGIAMFGGGFTGTPYLGIGFSETARDYRVGWRLTSARKGEPGFAIDLDATRREPANADAEHGADAARHRPLVRPGLDLPRIIESRIIS